MYDISLYPPIFSQSYMPAFIYNTPCRVYFQLSPLNSLKDLRYIQVSGELIYQGIQVSVRKQKNNQNALDPKYKADIMLCTLQRETTSQGVERFFIEITPSDIDGGFISGQYYKVQIRFTSSKTNGTNIPSPTTNAFTSWLTEYLQDFSEWSSIALIRPINQPIENIYINNSSREYITLYTNYIELSGDVTFSTQQETQQLERYRVYLYDNNNILKQDSGDIYSQNNMISYIVHTSLALGIQYKIQVVLITNNLYEWSASERYVTVPYILPMSADVQLVEKVNNAAGYIKLQLRRDLNYAYEHRNQIHNYYSFEEEDENEVSLAAYHTIAGLTTQTQDLFSSNEDLTAVYFDENTVLFSNPNERMTYYDSFDSNFLSLNDRVIIRRSSNKTDFSQWYTLADFTIQENDLIRLDWFDYTAEPGIWYRYQIVRYDTDARKTAELVTDEAKPVMLDTEDIFLNAEGEELIVRFNPIISGISNKVAESITDTIGSKYPFIRRNGNVNYKTFSLSGTISCFTDLGHNVFHSSKEELYGNAAPFYNQYNEEHNIDVYNDFIYEKMFRQKAIQFLQKPTVKLLRSLTEGNILVRLSNINFTPKETLGRKIYDFNCTVYEVAQDTEENYLKYDILKDNIQEIKKQQKNEGDD